MQKKLIINFCFSFDAQRYCPYTSTQLPKDRILCLEKWIYLRLFLASGDYYVTERSDLKRTFGLNAERGNS